MRRALVPALTLYALSRVIVLGAVAIALATGVNPGRTFLEAFGGTWDSEWYVQVAGSGYPPADPSAATATIGDVDSNGAFLPLFPVAIRMVAVITGWSLPAAGVVVAHLAGAAFAVVLWLLHDRLGGARFATRATALVVLFPGAFVLSMAYAEALMLALAAACLVALVDRSWVAAGILAAFAGITRPNAIVLIACCAWAAGVAIRRRGDRSALAAPLIAPLGFLAHLVFLWWRTGVPDAWFVIQRQGWGQRFDGFAQLIGRMERVLGISGPPPDVGAWMVPAGLVFVVVSAVLMWRWRPPAVLAIYAAGIVGLGVIAPALGTRPRVVLTAFPLVSAVAWHVRGWAAGTLAALSAIGLALLSVGYVAGHIAPP
ncbi:MAG: hypothetical protein KY437_06215 [Actinobacteria bacterium]|nr:hypothetical protein [Actinomycetota bacterium]